MKRKLIFTFLFMILILLIFIIVKSDSYKLLKIFNNKQAEIINQITFQEYSYNGNRYILVTMEDDEYGINEVIFPNGEQLLDCNGKNKVAFDYQIKDYLNPNIFSFINENNERISREYIYVAKNEFEYTGDVQEFVAVITGRYKIECWGASGYGSAGKGGYTSGEIILNTGDKLYVYVGQEGVTSGYSFNGGGSRMLWFWRRSY